MQAAEVRSLAARTSEQDAAALQIVAYIPSRRNRRHYTPQRRPEIEASTCTDQKDSSISIQVGMGVDAINQSTGKAKLL